MNSLPRWLLRSKGNLRGFLHSIVAQPKDSNTDPTSRLGGASYSDAPLWPMPVPYPEVFTKKVDSDDAWLKKLVSLQVVVLSWLHLGEPDAAPAALALGRKLSGEQWSVVALLRHLNRDGNTPIRVDASMMGRSAAKFEGIEKLLMALHRISTDVHVFGGGSDFYTSDLTRPDSFDDSWLRCGEADGYVTKDVPLTAKPITASRLNFPQPPAFDPLPYFDPGTAEVFLRPIDHAMDPKDFIGVVPVVKVNAAPLEKLELYRKLAVCGRLQAVSSKFKRGKFVSGLFAVGKNALVDRLILDARPPNLLEASKTFWCGSMGSGCCLTDIMLRQDEHLLSTGLDLRDFFYQFRISQQRIHRNILSGTITLDEARSVFGPGFNWPEPQVVVALSTLAMGDLLACEFSQSSHLGLLLQHDVCIPSQLICLRCPIPRSMTMVGVVIDDLIILERLAESFASSCGEGSVPEPAATAMAAYEMNGLEANLKKSFFRQSCSRFWGIEVDGRLGLLRASSYRLWPLIAITMRVVLMGTASVKLLEVLSGSWISILVIRRRMFCLMNIIFDALALKEDNLVLRLSPALCDELCSLAVLGPLAVFDLRAQFCNYIGATDASGSWMAGVRAPLEAVAVQEISRYSLKKSTWSRLLPPGKAYLREKGLLHPGEEMPAEGFVSHPLWSTVARSLDFKEAWRSRCKREGHINVHELRAFLIEEKRVARECRQRRILTGLDSQVALGALVKGRSSSAPLNRLLKTNLCFPLGSGIFNYFMYFLSEENRADGPTRDSAPSKPDLSRPRWLAELQVGSVDAFDEFISRLPADQQLNPFDFSQLMNGKKLDIRPRSRLQGAQKKKENTVNCAPKPHVCKAGAEPPVDAATLDIVKSFENAQFFYEGDAPDFSKPGGLDLFSGNCGVAREMVRAGCPWVLTFDWSRSVKEDLLSAELRGKKLTQGNSHCDFCCLLISLCREKNIAFFLENPDRSWLWRQKNYKEFEEADSPSVFRLSFCRFGTPWQKNTRIATSTRLRSLRMLCCCKQRHLALRGYSRLHKKCWTKVAEPYPRGLAKLLATALCAQAGWCLQKRLNVSGCCRCGSMRIGEAKNPGPVGRRFVDRPTLEMLPGVSAATLTLEARQLDDFLMWCSRCLKTVDAAELFDTLPTFAAQALRSFGDLCFQQRLALSNYRHLLIAFQRWKPQIKPFMSAAWDLVRRWELQEPVTHRLPVPEGVVRAMCVMAWQLGWYDWIGATLLAYYGGGRIGEVIRCRRFDLILPCDTIGEKLPAAFLQLRSFKSYFRQAAKIQHMKISDSDAVKLLVVIYELLPKGHLLFQGTASQYRSRWDHLLTMFGIQRAAVRLTPGGLRGGAAVKMYRDNVPIPQIMWALRLRQQSTLEFYLQEVGALTVFSQISSESLGLLRRVGQLFPLLPLAFSSG